MADRFGTSSAAIFRWSKKLQPQNTRNKPWKKLSKESFRNDTDQFPNSDRRESSKRLGISESGIQYVIKRLGVTYKKTLHHPKAGLEKRSMFC
nr:IS630 transposase-related protein [Holospora curviuscula]